ncbi:apolipoprotein D-like [Brevipalpus obovatus]|uniref:apolipoprotein D-like n=1 Tax=Brevipalpus obovatus TaxID=246614 RepID=UPI003D9EEE11
MLFGLFLLTISLTESSSAISFSLESCPIPEKPDEKFDIKKFDGVWYEIQRTLNLWEIGLLCARTNYTIEANNKLRLETKGVRKGIRGNSVNVTSVAYANNSKQANILRIKVSDLVPENPAWIVETDFDRYALMISCIDLLGLSRAHISWIMSREPTLDQTIIDRLRKRVDSLGFDSRALRAIDQSCHKK